MGQIMSSLRTLLRPAIPETLRLTGAGSDVLCPDIYARVR